MVEQGQGARRSLQTAQHAITPLCGAGSYGGGGAEEARGLAGSGMDGLVRFGGSGGDFGCAAGTDLEKWSGSWLEERRVDGGWSRGGGGEGGGGEGGEGGEGGGAEAAATRAVCAPAAEARPAVAPPRPQGPWACLAMTVHAMLGCELPT